MCFSIAPAMLRRYDETLKIDKAGGNLSQRGRRHPETPPTLLKSVHVLQLVSRRIVVPHAAAAPVLNRRSRAAMRLDALRLSYTGVGLRARGCCPEAGGAVPGRTGGAVAERGAAARPRAGAAPAALPRAVALTPAGACDNNLGRGAIMEVMGIHWGRKRAGVLFCTRAVPRSTTPHQQSVQHCT